jgi:hypothetical protein
MLLNFPDLTGSPVFMPETRWLCEPLEQGVVAGGIVSLVKP